MTPDIENLKNILKQLDKERTRISCMINDLEEVPKIKALVGKYFKYQNSYGGSKSSKWWTYYLVKEYKKDQLIVDYFQEYDSKKMEYGLDVELYPRDFFNPSYTEITKKEYDKAVNPLLDKINKQFRSK